MLITESLYHFKLIQIWLSTGLGGGNKHNSDKNRKKCFSIILFIWRQNNYLFIYLFTSFWIDWFSNTVIHFQCCIMLTAQFVVFHSLWLCTYVSFLHATVRSYLNLMIFLSPCEGTKHDSHQDYIARAEKARKARLSTGSSSGESDIWKPSIRGMASSTDDFDG